MNEPNIKLKVSKPDRALVEEFIRRRFRNLPSPVSRMLRVWRVGPHFAARVVLFDGGLCTLIVAGKSYQYGESRWIFRGLPPGTDSRGFYFDDLAERWERFDSTKVKLAEEY